MLASAHNAMVIETYTMSEFFLTFPMLLLHSILKTVVWLALIQLFGSIHTEILSNCYNINCVRDCCCHILRATHMQSVPFGRRTIIILCKSCETLIKTPWNIFDEPLMMDEEHGAQAILTSITLAMTTLNL